MKALIGFLAVVWMGIQGAEGAGVTLVDFCPEASGVVGSQDQLRPPTVRQAERQLFPLDWAEPMFRKGNPPREAAFFSGAEAWTDGAPVLVTDSSSGFMRLHSNNPPGWPDEPCVLWAVGENSSGQHMFHLSWVNVWTKDVFEGMAKSGGRVRAGEEASMAVTINLWLPEFRPEAMPGGVRFIVRNAGQTLVSEFIYRELVDGPTRIELPRLGRARWAVVELAGDSLRLPAAMEFKNMELEDVDAAGFLLYGSGSHSRVIRWSRFELVAEPVAGPTSYAGWGGGGFRADRWAGSGYVGWRWMGLLKHRCGEGARVRFW